MYWYLFEKTKINEKEAGDGPFKQIHLLYFIEYSAHNFSKKIMIKYRLHTVLGK